MPADRWCQRCRTLRPWVRAQIGRSVRLCAHCGQPTAKAKPKPPKHLYQDRRWSKAVRERDGHRCRKCGGPATDGAHIVRRAFLKTRHDPKDGLALCRQCHSFFGAHPAEWREWLEQEVPGLAAEMAAQAGAPIR